MIEELIIRVFSTRNASHLAHWAESSGYRHETLGEFYTDVIPALDAVIEARQGSFDLVEVEQIPKQPKVKDILKLIEDDFIFISDNRNKITGGLIAIDNLLQELESVYLKAIYKLRNLK